jgi:hypothetical protein
MSIPSSLALWIFLINKSTGSSQGMAEEMVEHHHSLLKRAELLAEVASCS